MRKITVMLLALSMAVGLMGCSSSGVSQAEYDKVVAERDALLEQVEAMGKTPSVDIVEPESTPSNTPLVQTGKFDADTVASQLDVKELSYSNDFWNYAFLTIKNNSEYNLDITANVKFYDDAGGLIGAKSAGEKAIESGYDTILFFMPDEKFAKMEYELEISEEEYYDCVVSDLSYEATEAKNKVILSVTNNGEEAAEFVQASVLFFSGDNLIGFSQNYITDDDSELKPGKTISKEMDCYEEFDSYQVIFTGRK